MFTAVAAFAPVVGVFVIEWTFDMIEALPIDTRPVMFWRKKITGRRLLRIVFGIPVFLLAVVALYAEYVRWRAQSRLNLLEAELAQIDSNAIGRRS